MTTAPYLPFVRDAILRTYRSVYAEQEMIRGQLLCAYQSMYADQEMMKGSFLHIISQDSRYHAATRSFVPFFSHLKKSCSDCHNLLPGEVEDKDSFFQAFLDFQSLREDGTLHYQILDAHRNAVHRDLGLKATSERVVSSALIYLANKRTMRDADFLASRILLLRCSEQSEKLN